MHIWIFKLSVSLSETTYASLSIEAFFETLGDISIGYFVYLIARFGPVGGRKGAGEPGGAGDPDEPGGGPTGLVLGAKSSFGGGIP